MGDGAFYVKRQAIWLIASWSLLSLALTTNLRRCLKWSGPALWMGCVLIAATLVMGTTVNGASRWLVLGPLQIQPSELVKPFVVLQAANLFAPWKRIGLDQKLLVAGEFRRAAAADPQTTESVDRRPDGTHPVDGGCGRRSALAQPAGNGIAGGALGTASILINEYQRLRVVSFLDPWQDPMGMATSWCRACWRSAPAG